MNYGWKSRRFEVRPFRTITLLHRDHIYIYTLQWWVRGVSLAMVKKTASPSVFLQVETRLWKHYVDIKIISRVSLPKKSEMASQRTLNHRLHQPTYFKILIADCYPLLMLFLFFFIFQHCWTLNTFEWKLVVVSLLAINISIFWHANVI